MLITKNPIQINQNKPNEMKFLFVNRKKHKLAHQRTLCQLAEHSTPQTACFEIGTFNICTLEGIQGELETLRNVVEAMLDCSHEYIVNFVILMVS